MFIDTHCHLCDERFEKTEVVEKNYLTEGVEYAINVGYDLQSSIKVSEQAERLKSTYFMVGIHPDSANQLTTKSLDFLAELSKHERCVGIGEIGLDYHYDGYDKEAQKKAFISQMELAKCLGLPISIHRRDCTGDMISLLKENKGLLSNGGIMHCFSGSVETSREVLNLGLNISFAGTITFKNANGLLDVVKYVPSEYMLSETDSPYLTPSPYRGQLNEPKMVKYVVEKISELKNLELEETAKIIKENARRVFKKIK